VNVSNNTRRKTNVVSESNRKKEFTDQDIMNLIKKLTKGK